MTEYCNSQHPDHHDEISRLNRLAGQVEGIKKMIEERRYCADIITQLRAVQSAAKSVEANILRSHLEGCVKDAYESGASKEKIDELITLFKKL